MSTLLKNGTLVNEGKIFKGGDWFDLGGMMNSLMSDSNLDEG